MGQQMAQIHVSYMMMMMINCILYKLTLIYLSTDYGISHIAFKRTRLHNTSDNRKGPYTQKQETISLWFHEK
jgi:hypothetical protein